MAKAEKSRHVRHKLDFYETNEELTLALLDVIQVPSNVTIVEPCNGLGAISRVSFTGDGKGDSVTTAWMLWGIKPVNGFYHTALTQNFAEKEAKYLARVTRQSTMRVCEATPDRETPRPLQAAEASRTAEAAAAHATDATGAQTAGTVDPTAATPAAAK